MIVAELLAGVLPAARHPGPQPPAVLHRAAARPRPGRPPGDPRPRGGGLTIMSTSGGGAAPPQPQHHRGRHQPPGLQVHHAAPPLPLPASW